MYVFSLWFSLDICTGAGLLDHVVVLFLVFKGASILFSIVAAIYIPIKYVDGGGGLVTKSCPTLCDPVDCSLPGSSVHGISQARNWSELPLPSARGLPTLEAEPASPACQADPSPPSHLGSPSGVGGLPFLCTLSSTYCL